MRLAIEDSAIDAHLSIIKDYDEITTLLVSLYVQIKNISPREAMSLNEFNDLIKGVDKSKSKWFLILIASVILTGYNRRQTMLKVGIYDILTKTSIKHVSLFNSEFKNIVNYIYQQDLLKSNIILTPSKLKNILDYRIKNVAYSDRIWNNTLSLNSKLFKVLDEGLSKNYTNEQMASLLSKVTNAGYASSLRLINTELSAVISSAQLEYLIESGVTRVQHVSVLDNRTSEICETRDGAIIKLEDAIIGENIPPLHPHCRSIVVPILE